MQPDDDRLDGIGTSGVSGAATGEVLGGLVSAGPIGIVAAIAVAPLVWCVARLVRRARVR